jgi:hypothetical protein
VRKLPVSFPLPTLNETLAIILHYVSILLLSDREFMFVWLLADEFLLLPPLGSRGAYYHRLNMPPWRDVRGFAGADRMSSDCIKVETDIMRDWQSGVTCGTL